MSITYSENHTYYLLTTLGRFQTQTLLAPAHTPQLILYLENYSPSFGCIFQSYNFTFCR